MRPIKKTVAGMKYHFQFKKNTPRKVLAEISSRYSAYLANDPDEELVDITTTEWFKDMERKMKPSDYLRHFREAHGLTQKALGDKLKTSAAHVSDWETGQRAISRMNAKKLAKIFNVNPGVFI
jgi:DNA-binding transcriptional regulator YiaG